MNDHEKAMRDEALDYARRRKWRVFPLQPGTTKPFPGTRGYLDATSNPKTIRCWWTEEYRGANIGIANDSKRGPIVVDIDAKAAAPFLKALGLPATLEATSGRDGSRHLYFGPNGATIRRQIRPIERDGEKVPFDILGDGGYVAAPSSYRTDTDQKYRWTKKRPLAAFPAKLQRLIEGEAKRAAKPSNDAHRFDLRKKKLPDVIREGERDTLLTSLAGSMRRRGASEDAILAALREENATRVDPPLDDKQVRKIARSIAKKDPDTDSEEALIDLNRTYAVVQVGGKVLVLQEQATGTIEFMKPADFQLLLGNRFIHVASGLAEDVSKRVPLAKAWLSWEARRQYDRVVFEPGAAPRQTVYNLWRGFVVQPSRKGSCDLFLKHVFENVCRGKRKRYEWLLSWFAQIVQNPGKKLGTAVVLRGPQGVGKSIVGATVGRLFGSHFITANSPRYVTGDFNAHLEQCVLLLAEEAFWAGDHRAEGKLKDLITNDTQLIEHKFVDPFSVANHVRVLVTSNAEWVVPAAYDERRFAVFDVSDAHQQDHDYFGAIVRELENGGYAKLLYTLQRHKYDEAVLRQVPWTAALREQIVASLPPKDAWLLELLTSGQIAGVRRDRDGRVLVATPALYKQYCAHARIVGVTRRDEMTEFGTWLKKWLPGTERHSRKLYDPAVGKKVSRNSAWLPPLAKARARFAERIRGYTWPTNDAWTLIDEALIH